MGKSFEEKIGLILSENSQIQPPPAGLSLCIIKKIEEKRRTVAMFKMTFFGLMSVLAVSSLVLVWKSEGQLIINSEAGKLFGLLFSDTATVLSLWKEYLLSLIESIPFVSVAVLFMCIWLTLTSIVVLIKNSKIFINHAIKHA